MSEFRQRSVLWRAFVGWLDAILLMFAVVLALVFFGPSEISAHAWKPAAGASRSGAYVPNNGLSQGHLLPTRWVEQGEVDYQGYQGAGPETVAIGPDGFLYTGLCDAVPGGSLTAPPHCRFAEDPQGWVLRINPDDPTDVTPYVRTGGRPLGLAFDAQGRLYIADGEKGLLRVESDLQTGALEHSEPLNQDEHATTTPEEVRAAEKGQASAETPSNQAATAQVAASETEEPSDASEKAESKAWKPSSNERGAITKFRSVVKVATCGRKGELSDAEEEMHYYKRREKLLNYTDSVTVAPDGTVYFTCPSQRWLLEEIRNDILENQPTGRVVRYEPCNKSDPLQCEKEVTVDGLMFANGIGVEKGGKSILVAEWSGFRVMRYPLDEVGNLGTATVFVENTPGYPDNLTIDDEGTVWLGLSLARQAIIDRFRPYPLMMKVLWRLPANAIPLKRLAWVVAYGPKLDFTGKPMLRYNLQDSSGLFDQATGVYPLGDRLFVGSYTDQNILCIPHPGKKGGKNACAPWERAQAKIAEEKQAKSQMAKAQVSDSEKEQP